MSSEPIADAKRRRLDVAIVGAPNSGKSQLLNVLLQSNVAAVSRKRHTTRDGILGARTDGDTQILFVDTPGFLRQKSARQEGLTRSLRVTALSEMQDVDYTLLVVDAARKITDDFREALVKLMLASLQSQGRVEGTNRMKPIDGEKFAIVLNKVDLVKPKPELLRLAESLSTISEECIKYVELGELHDDMDPARLSELFPTTFYTSALHTQGVDEIWKHLMKRATASTEWLLGAKEVTSLAPVERVEELLREKLYRCLHREVPHQVEQVNRIFEFIETDNGKVLRVDQDLVVRTKSHKKLVTGTGGKTLQRIQQTARPDLERMFECPVLLHLHVKLTKSKHRQDLMSAKHGTRIEFPPR